MKGRLSLLGVLLVALFVILLIKSDRARQIPPAVNGFSGTGDEVQNTVVPREKGVKAEPEVRRQHKKTPAARSVDETQIPAPSQEEATAPASLKIEVPPQTAPPNEESGTEDRLPYPWMDQVQEPQPGFVDPSRMDARDPSGDPIMQRPAPTGPGAGFYDPNDRYAEPD